MRRILTVGLVALVAVMTGCGGDDKNPTNPGGDQQQNKITLSGAVTATLDMPAVAAAWSSQDNLFGVSASVPGPPEVTIAIGATGQPHTGDYTNTSAGAVGGVVVTTADQKMWAAAIQEGTINQGTFTLHISNVGTVTEVTDGRAYTGMHGTIDASLPLVEGTGAEGTVTFHATF